MNDDEGRLNATELNGMLVLPGLMVLLMVIVSGYAWVELPGNMSIPVHWGMDGQPDRYGGKMEGLLLMPVVAFCIGMVFRFIPLIEPRRVNLLRSGTAYRMVLYGVCAAVWNPPGEHCPTAWSHCS